MQKQLKQVTQQSLSFNPTPQQQPVHQAEQHPQNTKSQASQHSKQHNQIYHHQQHQQPQSINIYDPALKLQDYFHYIKQYRNTIKPPIQSQQTKNKFCKIFDEVLLKRSLEEIGRYIKSKRQRKQSDAKFMMNNAKLQNKQSKNQHNQLRISCPANIGPGSFKIIETANHQKFSIGQLIDKLIMYSWQLINLRIIVACQQLSSHSLPTQILYQIHRFCISTSRVYVAKWGLSHNTMKAMQIAYFNLLKNRLFDYDPQRNGSLPCLIEAILGDTGNDHEIQIQFVNLDRQFKISQQQQKPNQAKIKPSKSNPQNMKKPKFPIPLNKKSSTQLQLQWFTYIIQHCMNHCQSFVKSTYTQLSNGNSHIVTHSSISFLHYISILLNKVINDRTTTQIVRGYSCHIQDIKKMYSNIKQGNTPGDEVKISWIDYQWLLGVLLKQMFGKYKQQIKKLWEKQYYGIGLSSDKHQHEQHWHDHSYIYCIMNIVAIANCCIFLGGYNHLIQKLTGKLIMSFALEFLQLSYLIYELCHAKKKNIQMKQLKKDYINNLQNLLHIKKQNKKPKNQEQKHGVEQQQIKRQTQIAKQKQEQEKTKQKLQQKQKDLHKLLPLQQGQLVSIIRLLSNLVHVNEQAQKYFQNNIKYFRIVMSLTHQFQSQLTMKNSAIVFLRNVAEKSSIMREQLAKLQIDVKVDNGSQPFI